MDNFTEQFSSFSGVKIELCSFPSDFAGFLAKQSDFTLIGINTDLSTREKINATAILIKKVNEGQVYQSLHRDELFHSV
ncbi:hypothetical protein [Paenibacillus chitinolyticus]|uniref:hypothetical protein n=1 Tax=Paenibacillus chitinolyticus TaxID=79263 RepID=UPI003648DEF2